MFKPKVVVTKEMMERLQLATELSGCASVEEFVNRALDEATDKVLRNAKPAEGPDVASITKKLKGLGYID